MTDDSIALITTLIAARGHSESHTGCTLITQSWSYGSTPRRRRGDRIPLPPLQSITQSVARYALDDTIGVVDPSTYVVDAARSPAHRAAQAVPAAAAAASARQCGRGRVHRRLRRRHDRTAGNPASRALYHGRSYTNRGDANAIVGPEAEALLAPYRIFKL